MAERNGITLRTGPRPETWREIRHDEGSLLLGLILQLPVDELAVPYRGGPASRQVNDGFYGCLFLGVAATGGCPGGRFFVGTAAPSCNLSNTWKTSESLPTFPSAPVPCVLSSPGCEKLLPPGVDSTTDHAPSRFTRA